MRGALYAMDWLLTIFGIIPAYAGSTACRFGLRGAARDHPRVCGEHGSHPRPSDRLPGSSPRMRGAHREELKNDLRTRIIPAYAGSTGSWGRCGRSWTDHPRVCGEHLSWTMTKSRSCGSSPRMRGAPFVFAQRLTPVGIIPAYAGSTPTGALWEAGYKDHPRVCGEHVYTPAQDLPS